MDPVVRQTPELRKRLNEQRHMEAWDNLMCAGKIFERSDQVEQIEQRLWERQLPRGGDDQ